MSRTHNTKPWKFRKLDVPAWHRTLWQRHAPAWYRRALNRTRRAKANQAVRVGSEPPGEPRDAAWYW